VGGDTGEDRAVEVGEAVVKCDESRGEGCVCVVVAYVYYIDSNKTRHTKCLPSINAELRTTL
jgi:hypothetical protein